MIFVLLFPMLVLLLFAYVLFIGGYREYKDTGAGYMLHSMLPSIVLLFVSALIIFVYVLKNA